jgi:hypothetical protein
LRYLFAYLRRKNGTALGSRLNLLHKSELKNERTRIRTSTPARSLEMGGLVHETIVACIAALWCNFINNQDASQRV